MQSLIEKRNERMTCKTAQSDQTLKSALGFGLGLNERTLKDYFHIHFLKYDFAICQNIVLHSVVLLKNKKVSCFWNCELERLDQWPVL